ncbi:terpene synthase 03 [Hibiscus trionum]|uniref:(+)-delta-cadinene synthase n=1 Tax=Hibiscus trionum TaxID=183268 RepID=A0A9W7HL14_HIBTR|nr:terpene synthase 03 [Hibiscus trionum]GMI79756.1 terpene synthase 03 [Hibiscus trionum]GMJ06715.1 terpene synthase 03 [Hibiscus trionum]
MALVPTTLNLCRSRFNPNQLMFPTTMRHQQVVSDRTSFHMCGAVSSTARISVSDQRNDGRRSANYQPTIWSYDFLQSLNNDHADEVYEERAAKLEQDVRFAMNDEDAEPVYLLELIDDIQRLGLAHRFETDIERALRKLVSSDNDGSVATEYSLYAAALRFRLLRQHGYEVSQDVFKAFKDNKGNFKECLYNDVKGMLSLYEASHLAFEGDDLMEEALTFSRMHLMDLQGDQNSEKGLFEQVTHAIELPLHRRMLRLEARWYIEAYNQKATANPTLLELAKLDFNMVQSTLQEDLKEMTRWWIGTGLVNKLNFARDRLMECFFWSVGVVSKPQFRSCRKSLTKVASLVTIIDDVYDVYGTLDELELFTDAVQRWDVCAARTLPKCMELCFLALYNTVNEMAYETLRDHGENIIPYLSKAWADLCKAFLKEAKWASNKHIPTFEDYLENAWMSASGHTFLVHAYFLQSSDITSEALDSLEQYHDVLRWPSTIFRLCNDLGTSKDELERGEIINSITCYMKETGCSEAMARQHISDLIDNCWKKINKLRIDGSPFAKQLLETSINLARISQCTYQHGDAHGCPDNLSKNRVQSLIVDPISID